MSTASRPLPHLWQTSLVKHKLSLWTWKQPEDRSTIHSRYFWPTDQWRQGRQYSLAISLQVSKGNPSTSLITSTTRTPTFQTLQHHLIEGKEIEVVRNIFATRIFRVTILPSRSSGEDSEAERVENHPPSHELEGTLGWVWGERPFLCVTPAEPGLATKAKAKNTPFL